MSKLAFVDTLADPRKVIEAAHAVDATLDAIDANPRRSHRTRKQGAATPRPRRRERQKSLASFLAPTYSSRQTRLRITGSGMRASTRRSCTVINLEPIIFALDIFTLSSPFASAHFTFCTIASHRTRTW